MAMGESKRPDFRCSNSMLLKKCVGGGGVGYMT